MWSTIAYIWWCSDVWCYWLRFRLKHCLCTVVCIGQNWIKTRAIICHSVSVCGPSNSCYLTVIACCITKLAFLPNVGHVMVQHHNNLYDTVSVCSIVDYLLCFVASSSVTIFTVSSMWWKKNYLSKVVWLCAKYRILFVDLYQSFCILKNVMKLFI